MPTGYGVSAENLSNPGAFVLGLEFACDKPPGVSKTAFLSRSAQFCLRRLASVAAALTLIGMPMSAAAQLRPVVAAWDPNADALTAGYQVLVGTSPNQPIAILDVQLSTSVSLPLPAGGIYYVAVRAYTASGSPGPASAETVVDLSSPPGPPSAMRADVNGPSVRVSWGQSATGGAALTYLLSAGTTPGSTDVLANAPIGNVNAIGGDLPPGVYYVRVHGANLVGVGPGADLVVQVGGGFRPLPPGGLNYDWSGSTVRLAWYAPTGDPASLPTTYIVEAGTSPGASNVGVLNVGNALSFSAPVPPGAYYVRVRGVNARGHSDASNEIVIRR